MITTSVFIISLVLLLFFAIVFGRAIVMKKEIFGRPPVPVLFFVLAKGLVVVNLTFLFLRGLKVTVPLLFLPNLFLEVISLILAFLGTAIIILTAIQLNNDLIFGLSSSGAHRLQTRGVFSLSRHPFYLGFLFVLFSSCLFTPHIINIIAFAGAWLIHHFIMIKEEEFLIAQYGEEYRQYAGKVKRYITLK
jgi:protein-S-isoprenylcysteine O-methyltransferase Ste14